MNNTINKLTFDFTCVSETKAREIQKEIANYIFPKLNELLTYSLENDDFNYENSTIDRLEIDLGDIQIHELQESQTLNIISEAILKKLNRNYQNDSLKVGTVSESNFELITTFLLNGDLPWWVDKKQPIDLENILKNQIENNVEALKVFLEKYQKNESLRQRFLQYINPSTWHLLTDKGLDLSAYNIEKTLYFDTESIENIIELVITNPNFFKYNLFEIFRQINFEKMIQSVDNQEFEGIFLTKQDWVKSFKKVMKKDIILIDFMSENISELSSSNEKILFNQIPDLPQNFKIVEDEFKENVTDKTVQKILTSDEIEIISKIFKNKVFETEFDKKIIEKLLLSLSKETLKIIYFLTQLSEEEISFLLTQNKLFEPKKSKINEVAESEISRKLLAYIQPQIVQNIQKKEVVSEEMNNSDIVFENRKENRKIIIENAGLCIVNAYLSGFWKNIDYLENNKFKSVEYANNAIHLMQYMATGQRNSPEYLLQFNKLLCGLAVDDFLPFENTITDNDFAEADNLLEAIITNWKALKNTSIEGLRTSFLQRKGILAEKEKHWVLQVERKGFDLLLDSLPWGFSMIKLPWMKKFIEVEW